MIAQDGVRAIADAVLYEGLSLFPYRKSALKNQQPFQFGVLMPQGYRDSSEPTALCSQMVLLAPDDAANSRIEGLLRFLQSADEPVAREVPFSVPLHSAHTEIPFEIDIMRGTIALDFQPVAEQALQLTLHVRNDASTSPDADRNAALRSALIGAQAVLRVGGSAFVSLLDPPQQLKTAVSRCRNERIFPVLVGEPGESGQTSETVLVSPIILYDFPSVAAASRGNTYDATEIDELLMLSVASLADREKQEMRASHSYARELLERAEALDADTLASLHAELTGAAKEPGDETVIIAGTSVGRGSLVRVHPKGRADLWDDLVQGMTGRVCAVHTDFEGERYVGVVFDGDPASDMHEWYGRSFFYKPGEIEPLP